MNVRIVATALVLALCCGATPAGPQLDVHAPWESIFPVPAAGSEFQKIAEWVLPNGRPDSTNQVLQYLIVYTKDLDERGLGGYVADEVGSISRTHEITDMKYHQIDTCFRPAWYVSYDVPVGGVQRTLEVVYIAFRSTLYEAEYIRPADQAVEPSAEASILAFCNSVPKR